MKTFRLLVIPLLSIAFLGCNKENVLQDLGGKYPQNEQVANAWQIVLDFSARVNPTKTKASILADLKISEVLKDSILFQVKTNDTIITKALGNKSEEKVNLYHFSFTKDGKQGFAIVTDDERIPQIMAYVESGTLADTAINPGMAIMINSIPYGIAKDLDNYYLKINKTNTKTEPITQNWTLGQYLMTSWNTEDPYNNLYKDGSCTSTVNGKVTTSSVAIALAQAMVSYECKPDAIKSRYSSIEEFNNVMHLTSNHVQAYNIQKFIHDIDEAMGTKYSCGGSKVDLEKCSLILDQLGYLSGKYYNYTRSANDKLMFRSLQVGTPAVWAGKVYKTGQYRAWLIDGLWGTATSAGDNLNITGLHCLWGFPGDNGNGWYKNPHSPYDDYTHKPIMGPFDYDMQYCYFKNCCPYINDHYTRR